MSSFPIAVDFSDARPTIAQLKGSNVTIVIRYLTGVGNKPITPLEFAEYLLNGLAVAFVFETGAADAASGEAGGTQNAHAALAALNALNAIGCPVYFAVDQDIAPSAAVPYFQGINSVMQPSQVGVYGEGALCTLLQTDGLATWFWQSESTSFPGNASTLSITHLQQHFNTSPVPGTDLDTILKPDVGQWPRPKPPVPTPTPEEDFGMFIAVQDNEEWLCSGNTAVHITSPADSANFQAAGVKALPQPMSAGQWALFTKVS